MPTDQELLQQIARDLQALSQRVNNLESTVTNLQGVSAAQRSVPSAQASGVAPLPVPKYQPALAGLHASAVSLPKAHFETEVGVKWLGKVGIVAIAIGMAYLLKYTITSPLFGITIGPVGRILSGFIAGIIMLTFGEFFHRRYPQWSKEFTGGGLGILYFAIFAASNLEGDPRIINNSLNALKSTYDPFIPYNIGLIFMSIITAAAGWFSIRYDSKIVALFGLLGGYLTPLLIGFRSPSYNRIMFYMLILNIGVCLFAYFRKWRVLNALALCISAIYSIVAYQHMSFSLATMYLVVFFVLFVSLGIVYNMSRREKTTQEDLFVLLVNPLLTMGHLYVLFHRFQYENYLGLVAMLFAVFYIALAYGALMRNREDRYLVLTLTGLAAGFVAVAIPWQLDTYWMTIAWAMQFIVMLWIGLHLRQAGTRTYALIIGVIMLIRLLFIDITTTSYQYKIAFANPRMLTGIFIIVLIYLAAYLYKYYRINVRNDERQLVSILAVAANITTLYLFSNEINIYYRHQLGLVDAKQVQGYATRRTVRQAGQLAISIFWLAYATMLIIVGITKKFRSIRLLALFVFGISLLKIVLYDLSGFEPIYRIIAFVLLGIALIFASYMYTKNKETILNFIREPNKDEDVTANIEEMSDQGKTHVLFTLSDGKQFKVTNANVVKICLAVESQFGKRAFEPQELLGTYQYYEKHFRSRLSAADLETLKKYLHQFAVSGGSFEMQ